MHGPTRHQSGFTLIELMVVLVIIGVILGMATLSMGDGGRGRQLETEARRLAQLLELASEEAVLQSQIMGLRIEEDGYAFMRLEGSVWQELPGDRMFRPRRLPDDIVADLSLEGVQVGLGRAGDARSREEEETVEPQIFILSSGELTPFELRLERLPGETFFTVSGSPVGVLELEGPFGGG